MRPIRSSGLLVLLATVLVPAGVASAETVTYAPGEGSYVRDGNVGCIMSTSDAGVGSVVCAGPDVYDALWKGTKCDDRTKLGCSTDKEGIRSIRLTEKGRSKRGWIEGVGGMKDTQRGDSIVMGRIKGKHLTGGGFTFTNASGHGFTLTDDRLRRF